MVSAAMRIVVSRAIFSSAISVALSIADSLGWSTAIAPGAKLFRANTDNMSVGHQ